MTQQSNSSNLMDGMMQQQMIKNKIQRHGYCMLENNFSNEVSFDILLNRIRWQQESNGYKCSIVCNETIDCIKPLVRSTMSFNINMKKICYEHELKRFCDGNWFFNNVMIELYYPNKSKMPYHSDCALDLQPNSVIAILTIYADSNVQNHRVLRLKNKRNGQITEIKLLNWSIFFFCTKFNQLNTHCIINPTINKCDSLALHLTYRQSKTMIKTVTDQFQQTKIIDIATNNEIKIATEYEKTQFYCLKKLENQTINFEWPKINYILS